MKFITSLKFLVILLVTLSVFTKRVKRSKSASSLYAQMKQMAEVKAFCYTPQKTIDGRWLHLDTNSATNGQSGFILRNYYKGESFDCPQLYKISTQDSKNRYFVSYRRMSSYEGAYSVENNVFNMRQLGIQMQNSVTYALLIDKKVFTDDINDKELKNMVSNLKNNKNSYLTKFFNFKSQLNQFKAKAEDLADLKARNIQTSSDLQAQIAAKKIELKGTQEILVSLNNNASALALQIRNYEKEMNKKKTDELDPSLKDLQESIQILNALDAQVRDNDQKIKGIVPIDQSDLTASNTKLRDSLLAYQQTYLDSDPKFTLLGNLITKIETQMDNIPTILLE